MTFTKFLILILQTLQVLGFALTTIYLRRWYRQSAKIDLKRSTGWAFNTSCVSIILVIMLVIDGNDRDLLLAGIIQIMVIPSLVVALLKGKLTI